MFNRSVFIMFLSVMLIAAGVDAGSGSIRETLTWQGGSAPICSGNRLLCENTEARLDAAGGYDLPMVIWNYRFPAGSRVDGLEVRRLEFTEGQLETPLTVLPPKPTVAGSILSGPVANSLMGGEYYPEYWYESEVRRGLSPDTFEPAVFVTIRLYPVRVRSTHMLYLTAFEADLLGTGQGPQEGGTATPERDNAAMLIIAPQAFLDVMQDFITHKTARGVSVLSRSLEDIEASGTGRDVAEKVKTAIHELYFDNSINFVLLAGDADKIPVRYTFHADYGGSTDWQNIPADLYYADILNGDGDFCDWDANGNSVFGEYADGNIDGCDFAPDVLIGRIPASTVAELTGVLNKLIHYEETVTGSEDWQNRIILAAADTFTAEEHGDQTGVPEGETTKELIAAESLSGYELIKLYETDWYPHTAELTTESLNTAILNGARYVNFANHGWIQGWAFDGGYSVTEVDALDNYERLPFVFGYACSTAVFDTENPQCPDYGTSKCLAEAFILNPGGGAAGYLGATRTAFAGGHGYGGSSGAFGLLDCAYFRGVGEGHSVQGRLWLMALLELLLEKGITDPSDYISVLELHYFGDPSMAAGGTPAIPEFRLASAVLDDSSGGDADACIEAGERIEIPAHLANDGAPAHHVTVTLTSASSYVTIINGTAVLPDFARGDRYPVEPVLTFDIDAGCPGGTVIDLNLAVTSDEANTDLSIRKATGEGPYLTADQIWITQDENIDNIASPGESVKFAPGLLNIGCQTAAGWTSTITIDDPYVVGYGVRGDGVLPDLQPGVPVISQKLFYADLDPLTPDSHSVICDMTFTAPDSSSQFAVSLPIVVRDLVMPTVSRFKVDPATPDPGQEVTVTVKLEDPAGVLSAGIDVYPDGATQPISADFYDDGLHGDGNAGDMIFGTRLTLPDSKCYMLANVSAEDTLGNRGTVTGAGGIVTVPFICDDPILVIGGADNDLNLGLYTQALEDAGYGYDVWSYYRGLPPNDILDRYVDGAVILYFSFTYPYLDQDARDSIDYYLAQGGNLLITEQDIGWVMIEAGTSGMADWYHNTLLADYINDNSGCHQVAGAGDFDDLDFSIAGGSGADNQDYPSLIEPIAPAETCFIYSDYSGPQTGTAGIRASRNGAKHIYLAFGFEGIAAQADRAAAMNAMMQWFEVSKTPRMCPFNQSPGFWTGPEIPVTALYAASAFRESDMTIYQAGGLTPAGQPISPAAVYAIDTASHSSSDTGVALNGARFYHAAACLDDHGREKIYFIGGLNGTGNIANSVEVFDPVDKTVSVLTADPLPAAIDGIPGSYAVCGNKLYIIGQARFNAPYQTGNTWVFDPMAPDGSRWTTLEAELNEPRFFAGTAVIGDLIYLIGGITQVTENDIVPHSVVSVLDTSAGTPVWQDDVVSPMPGPMFFNAAVAIPDGANVERAGQILTCGGYNGEFENGAFWYDPAVDAWSDARPMQKMRLLTRHLHLVPKPRGPSVWVVGGHYDGVYADTEILYLGDDPVDCWIGVRTYPETIVPGCCLRVGLDLAGDKAVTPVDCYLAMEILGGWYFITADPGFPTFSSNPLPLFVNAPLPENLTYCGPLFEIPFPVDMPALNGCFYAATLVHGTSGLAGGLAWADFRVP